MAADGQDRLKQDPTKVSSGWAGLSTQLIIGATLLDHLAGIDAEDVSGLYSGDGYDLVSGWPGLKRTLVGSPVKSPLPDNSISLAMVCC